MSRLDTSYFVDEITIPNIADEGIVGDAVVATVERYIERYEPEFLAELLGEDLRDDYLEGIDDNSPLAKWIALDTQLYNATALRSPVANYVFFHYYRSNFPAMGQAGDFIPTGNAGAVRFANERLVSVWNDMVKQAQNIYNWIVESGDYDDYDYPLFQFTRMNVVGI